MVNLEKVEYFLWFDKPDVGFLNVYLKETGKRKVEEAIKHFKELEFVQRICIYSEYLYIMLFINNVNRIITKNINKMNIALAKLLRKR